jgi:hypothetical protein
MALQVALELDSGITLPEAYVRMTSGFLSLDELTALIAVQYFANKEARDTGKPPVLIKQFLCGNTGYKPPVQAKYELKLINVAVGSGEEINLDLNADGLNEDVLIEGVNLETDGTIETLTTNVVAGLNAILNFNQDFVASSHEPGIVIIEALKMGGRTGTHGNGIVINGNIIDSITQTINGVDMVPSPFMTYFNIDKMNEAGINIFIQAYEFLKSLPDFEGYIDMLP